MQSFDVVVLGGGPAGSAAAIALRRGNPAASVAMVECASYEGRRVGETLPPNIDAVLRELGVWQAFLDTRPLPAYGVKSCWGGAEPVENEFIFHAQGRGWHLDRARFDRMLSQEAERAGAHVFQDTRVTSHTRSGKAWTLSTTQGEFDARFVVDATGRNASFAVQQCAAPVEDDRLAACFLFFGAPSSPPDSCALVEAFDEGWFYSAALPDGSIAAAIFSDTDILRATGLQSADDWLRLLVRAPETARRLEGARPMGATLIRSASSRQLDPVAGEGWLAAGDAASTFDPLSSQGIYKALRSGIFAAYAIRDAAYAIRDAAYAIRDAASGGFARYSRFVRDEYAEYLDVRAAYYAQEQRWPRSAFWQRRHETITLDPARILTAAPVETVRRPMHLNSADVDLLRDVCRRPVTAHAAIREFLARSPRPLSERRAVLAVQELVKAGVL